MALKVQDGGLLRALEDLRAQWNATTIRIHLYKNDYAPTTSTALGDLTEADFAGYASQLITTWGIAAVAAHIATITAEGKTFTRSTTGAAQTIYGYYITRADSAVLYWAERFATPRVLVNLGDAETVIPVFDGRDLST